jgi:single-strand DNA-binding protein
MSGRGGFTATGLNVVVLIGRLARPTTERVLPSGDRLVAYEVTVPRPGERAESVPVVWHGAPLSALDFEVDDELLAVGRVRRRFFRSGGRTESRTEVIAETVIPTRQRRHVQKALARAQARLDPGPA